MLLLLSTVLANEPGDEIAEVAERYLEETPPLRIEACNGLVEDVLRDAGYPMRGRVTMLYADMEAQGWVHHEQIPYPGDIVFFDRTYDSNGNGRPDDKLSHIAIVIDVDTDGTVHMVHRSSSGIKPLTMNLRYPHQHKRGDKVVNSYLAARNYGAEGRQLAGELWTAFATVEGELGAVAVSDEHPRTRTPPRNTSRPLIDPPRVTSRVREGRGLKDRHLRRLSCTELWYLRNAVFARHGYAFETPEAVGAFATEDWYWRNEAVNASTADAWLTATDRENVSRIRDFEEHCED